MKQLFSDIPFGRIQLKNRLVMAPMTRSRAIGNVPNEMMVRYYAERASAGLIIVEGTAPSPNGLGYARIPGLFSKEQVEGWKKVTDQVHHNGGRIFVQLMHTGRVSHPANMLPGSRIVAPSAIQLSGSIYTDAHGLQPYPVPLEMTESDIKEAIGEFVSAGRLAINAGFDGVEIHGANGYLIDQFFNTTSNKRNDQWGSSTVENRIRFAVEIAKQLGEAIGFDRLGIRLSPEGVFNDMSPDSQTEELFERLAKEFWELGLLYIHVLDQSSLGAPEINSAVMQKIRGNFKGRIILSGGFDAVRAENALLNRKADLIAFGRPYISNPDLVMKLRDGRPLVQPDPTTFYTPGEKGYLDYE